MPDYAAQRFNMVVSQVQASGVIDDRILAAMGKVERERFVPAAKRAIAYAEAPLEIVSKRFLLDPRTFSLMINAAEIGPDDKILDVGCLSGYSTAVLGLLAERVIGLEHDTDLVRVAGEAMAAMHLDNAVVVQGSLSDGFKPEAPYDVIIVNGGIEERPAALVGQLAPGGRLVAIIGSATEGKGTVFLNEGGHLGRRVVFDAPVPMLAGFRRPVGFVF